MCGQLADKIITEHSWLTPCVHHVQVKHHHEQQPQMLQQFKGKGHVQSENTDPEQNLTLWLSSMFEVGVVFSACSGKLCMPNCVLMLAIFVQLFHVPVGSMPQPAEQKPAASSSSKKPSANSTQAQPAVKASSSLNGDVTEQLGYYAVLSTIGGKRQHHQCSPVLILIGFSPI